MRTFKISLALVLLSSATAFADNELTNKAQAMSDEFAENKDRLNDLEDNAKNVLKREVIVKKNIKLNSDKSVLSGEIKINKKSGDHFQVNCPNLSDDQRASEAACRAE